MPRANVADLVIALGGDLAAKMPAIGVGAPWPEAAATLDAVEGLRKLRPRFLVCSVDGRDLGSLAQLRTYREIAEATSAGVVLEIVIPDDQDARASLAPVAQEVRTAELNLDAVIVSSAADLKSWQPGAARPEKPPVEEIASAARAAFPGVRLGGGMLATFTELNRKRPKPDLFDYVSHTTCSIVHAADDRSVMETLETLPAILASTRATIGGKPYWIGPSAIGARDNPYGKGVAGNPGNGRICLSNRDPRQRGLFNAAWSLGYIANCAYGGVDRVAMGAATGPFGFIWRRGEYVQPYFDSLGGPLVYPAFHVLAGLAGGVGRQLVEARPSENGRAAALAWREDGDVVLWIANLTAEPLTLRITGVATAPRRASILDAASFGIAVRNPHALDELSRALAGEKLTLDAYAVARIS
jgi:hypothetical protein